MLCIPNEHLGTINMTNCPTFDDWPIMDYLL
jgi:hypothetical protein